MISFHDSVSIIVFISGILSDDKIGNYVSLRFSYSKYFGCGAFVFQLMVLYGVSACLVCFSEAIVLSKACLRHGAKEVNPGSPPLEIPPPFLCTESTDG